MNISKGCMKQIGITLLLIFTIPALAQTQESPRLKGEYFGQEPPGEIAVKFNNGVLVGDRYSFNISFSPDGQEMFFSYYKSRPENPKPAYEIKTYTQVSGVWEGPVTAFFSGVYSDVDITFSPDGSTLFFVSDRPHPRTGELDIYYIKKVEGGWSQPIYAGEEVNSGTSEVYPSLSDRGNLFFASGREGGFGAKDIYKAEWVDGQFANVVNLGPAVNTEHNESNPFIAPDESYIVFNVQLPENDFNPQIYVSFQLENGSWTKAESLGESVNTIDGESAATITPDEKYLFFKRREGVNRGIHWISTDIIKRMRTETLKH
ncbi:MAG: hypothetical protein GY906_11980 [bacterium]|nr:hypothetical protein [bacterium]